MNSFYKAYREAENELRAECDAMVKAGKMSQEYADFRFDMVRDEILWSMMDEEEMMVEG